MFEALARETYGMMKKEYYETITVFLAILHSLLGIYLITNRDAILIIRMS